MSQPLTDEFVWCIPGEDQAERAEFFEADIPKRMPIRTQVKEFLNAQIQLWKPTLIVVIERKGTAVLRSLMEGDSPIQWNWENVISSKVLEEVSPGRLAEQRILVFDDMMKRGVHIKELLGDLKKLGVDLSSQVRVAVFAVHEESLFGTQMENMTIPHAWYRRGLNTQDYTAIRSAIVEMLQESGSLMLDTEHLEVRVRLVGSFDRFVKALRRTGRASVFTSASQRVNITVLYEDDEIHTLPMEEFPAGTRGANIVKKCRVVQRTGNEFALIPICFPAIPAGREWLCSPELQKLLGRSVIGTQASDLARFYGVGLRAALRVLRWTLKDLYAEAPNEFTISTPGIDASRGNGYHLGHLRVMYPTLDIDYLNKWIARIDREERSASAYMPRREPLSTPILRNDELHAKATELIQEIMAKLDRKRIEAYWTTGKHIVPHPFGLTAEEVFNIGQRHSWERILLSTLFDVLIDEAALVTHVQQIPDAEGAKLVERTFEPDGEIVSESVRRFTMQWGITDAS